MPRLRPTTKDREMNFGSELKAAIVRKRMDVPAVATKVGFTPRTMSNRFTRPGDMTLSQMRSFIKITDMDIQIVVDYLLGK